MASDDKEHDLQLSELTAISSIDGRYASRAKRLRNYFSEYAIIKYRVKAEVQWLLALSANPQISEVPEFTEDERAGILALVSEFDETAARRVKEIERTTNHDVKAVEYYIKEKMESLGERTSKISEFVHFACTSEDITNLAYAQALGRSRESVMLPAMDGLIGTLKSLAHEHASLPMLCRTHGQPATPSTLGKEIANFAYRMQKHRDSYAAVAVLGKMNGAVGNFNAHEVAYPEVDWETFAAGVMSEGLGVEQNPYTTQIETHDYKAEMFDSLTRFNDVLLDFNRDMWSYISLGYFKQIAVKGEVGSSTMPHKVNPIDFENSEGNLGVATAMFQHMARKLAVSRYQRDLSDSTVLRTIGTGFAHTIVAIASTQKGLTRVQPNEDKLAADLDDNWEVLGEPVQTVMRRYSVSEPYEKLKALTRGKKVDAAKMREFVEGLRGQEMPDSAIDSMLELTPGTYTGKAEELAKRV